MSLPQAKNLIQREFPDGIFQLTTVSLSKCKGGLLDERVTSFDFPSSLCRNCKKDRILRLRRKARGRSHISRPGAPYAPYESDLLERALLECG